MKYVKIDKVNGCIKAPPSKSESIRAILISLFAKSEFLVKNYSNCDDSLAAINILNSFQDIDISKTELLIKQRKGLKNNIYNVSESGLIFRSLPFILPIFQTPVKIKREGSLCYRSMNELDKILNNLGIEFYYNDDKSILTVKTSLKPDVYHLNLSESSQSLSGVLIAMTQLSDKSTLYVDNIISRDYINLTIEVLKKFGLIVSYFDNKFEVEGNQEITTKNYKVNGDWSGAAFMIVAAAISGKIGISDINIETAQGDKIILDVIEKVGAKLHIEKDKILVESNHCNPFEFNAINNPDLVMPLVVLGLYCNGKSVISNVDRLTNKESNRLEVILNEMRKLNAKIHYEDNKLIIYKSQLLMKENVSVFNDHRIAMMFAICSLLSYNPIKIDNFDCVNKSYPKFWKDFQLLGGTIYE